MTKLKGGNLSRSATGIATENTHQVYMIIRIIKSELTGLPANVNEQCKKDH